MTDLWGDEIAIYGPHAPPRCNELGYIATPQTTEIPHDAIVATIKASSGARAYRESIVEKILAQDYQ